MVTIYLLEIKDLLLPEDRLPIECKLALKGEDNFFVEGATQVEFRHSNYKKSNEMVADIKNTFNNGVDQRLMRSTDANETSSRSHLLFSLTITYEI